MPEKLSASHGLSFQKLVRTGTPIYVQKARGTAISMYEAIVIRCRPEFQPDNVPLRRSVDDFGFREGQRRRMDGRENNNYL